MALNATWWATGYADHELVPDFSLASVVTNFFSHGGIRYREVEITPVYNLACPGGNWQNKGTKNHGDVAHGYFMAELTAFDPPDYFYAGFEDIRGGRRVSGYRPRDARGGGPDLSFPYAAGGTVHYLFRTDIASDETNFRLWCWQPRCWLGTVAQVIGSIIRSLGLAEADIVDHLDATAFSHADDGQRMYGPDQDGVIKVFYRREPGQTIAQAIMALSRHSWDLLGVDMRSRLTLVSRRKPTTSYTVDGLVSGSQPDGVIVAQWIKSTDHIVNHAIAGYGRWVADRPGVYSPLSDLADVYQDIQNLPNPSGFEGEGGVPWQTFEIAASEAKYGRRTLTTSQARFFTGAVEESLDVYHMPYLTSDANSGEGAAMLAEIGVVNFFERLAVDCLPRREIRVVQDMRGADYDVGWLIKNVALTRDGVTVGEARCINKVIDFNDMTVTSTLLEEPEVLDKSYVVAPVVLDIPAPDAPDPLEMAISAPIPAGGTTGQVLAKSSDDDFDVEWVTP